MQDDRLSETDRHSSAVERFGVKSEEAVGPNPTGGTNPHHSRSQRWRVRQPLGNPDCPYAYRWIVPLGPLGSIRVHKWVGNDDPRAAHDHPSDFLTIVLKGGYREWYWDTKSQAYLMDWLRVGSIRYRKAEHRHIVELMHNPTWTLLWFAPDRRDWGFYKPRKIGGFRFVPRHKWFTWMGHHQCDT